MSSRTEDRDVVLDIEGMTCASCVAKIEEAAVNLATRTATVHPGTNDLEPLLGAVQRAGYRGRGHEAARDPKDEARGYTRRLIVAVACTVPVLWLSFLAADRAWTSELAVVAVWRDEAPVGAIGVSDRIKLEAPEAVRRTFALGLDVVMVTGDRRGTAEAIAAQMGIDEVLAEVFPDGKVEAVARLRSQGRHVVFAGDGLNDAPALAAADVGIAMGTGTDVALAAADVNLLGGTLSSVADSLELAGRTYRIITQNLFWAFAYNVVMIPLAVLGILNPMWAAAAMALSSVTVVVNALRLRRFRIATSIRAAV